MNHTFRKSNPCVILSLPESELALGLTPNQLDREVSWSQPSPMSPSLPAIFPNVLVSHLGHVCPFETLDDCSSSQWHVEQNNPQWSLTNPQHYERWISCCHYRLLTLRMDCFIAMITQTEYPPCLVLVLVYNYKHSRHGPQPSTSIHLSRLILFWGISWLCLPNELPV